METILSNPIYQSDIKLASELPINWNYLSGKTILFTGATGMIASVMIDILMYTYVVDATKAILDSSKIEQLGWKAQTPINIGLSKTVRILRERSHHVPHTFP